MSLYNPTNDELVSDQVHCATAEDVDLAVEAAVAAFGPWKAFSGAQRSTCLLRVADLMEKKTKELAHLESLPTGRPISGLVHFDIPHMIQVFRCKSIQYYENSSF